MKPVAEWDEDYIMSLPVGEFDWFEAKGRGGLDLTVITVVESAVRQTLSKALSAFANSGGGQLVYGLKNPEPGATEWQVDDGGIATTNRKGDTREWLESIVSTLVDAPLTKFNVYQVLPSELSARIAPGRALYVVDIPDSPQAPHQAYDNIYYARVGGRSRPIGHRLVSDIFNRRRDPKLTLAVHLYEGTKKVLDEEASIESRVRNGDDIYITEKQISLIVKAENVGRIVADHVAAFITVPTELLFQNEHTPRLSHMMAGKPCVELVFHNLVNPNFYRDGRWWQGEGRHSPILPNLSQQWSIELRPDYFQQFPPEQAGGDYNLYISLYADGAEEVKEYFPFNMMKVVHENAPQVYPDPIRHEPQ